LEMKKSEEIFGKILKKIRAEKGFSQEKLALEADLDRTFISLLERGLRQPSLNTLLQISKSLDIKASEIVAQVEIELSNI
uniref:helix-turn-helix domain-containing protein n=1 Tax=Desulforegula conservatrix TaxID=153026 RepID=UPI002FBD6350